MNLKQNRGQYLVNINALFASQVPTVRASYQHDYQKRVLNENGKRFRLRDILQRNVKVSTY